MKQLVPYLDQWHLAWGDARGYVYVWGPSSQRVTLPIINERERQTYYGAINPVDGEVTAILADAGNGYWTCIFVEYLREQYAGKRLIICWDGASYHRGQEMRDYLEALNYRRSQEDWLVHCVQFAPYAPQQNPIEDVWLQAKAFVRKNWDRCDETFESVKRLFEEALETITCDFKKMHMYTRFLEII
jgi:transposase